jgi:hypothetical protein
MLDWFTETGFGYLLGVAVVTLIGVLLVYRGLWGDRSKGQARCPKCWYDMRGTVPRLECPECGHDARQERRLHKHHRRWGGVTIGVVLVLLSAYPLTIIGGWWREQAAIRKFQVASAVSRRWIGPTWLVERLPGELRRFFARGHALVVGPTQLPVCRSRRHLRTLTIQPRDRQDDAGLVHLRGLSKLEALYLPYTQVTDSELRHLAGLSNLKNLSLTGTKVTDAGLVHLKGLTNLTYLVLAVTQVTDAGAAELQQALPNATIVN